MILEMDGDLLKSPADALVNPINTIGVMGAGLALLFKEEYPDMFEWYKYLAERRILKTGQMTVWSTHRQTPRFIINFPTKNHWADPSRLEWIVAGCAGLLKTAQELELTSLAVPALGCGHGGLTWEKVKPVIVRTLQHLDMNVYLYPPRPVMRKPNPGEMTFSH